MQMRYKSGYFKNFLPWNLWKRFLAVPIDNALKTVAITVIICLIASVIVTFFALRLHPLQARNALNEKRINILQVAGIYNTKKSIDSMFKKIFPRVVDLRTGRYTNAVGANFNTRKAAQNSKLSRSLSKNEDTALIGRQSYYQVVYFVEKKKGIVSRVIIPVHGYGLWSMLYGFMAIAPDGNTIKSLRFYSQEETPGLGGKVNSSSWRALWHDKKIYNKAGRIAISVVKNARGNNQVDAISGATLTSTGVNNLVRFWVGKNGFGPFLKHEARRNWR